MGPLCDSQVAMSRLRCINRGIRNEVFRETLGVIVLMKYTSPQRHGEPPWEVNESNRPIDSPILTPEAFYSNKFSNARYLTLCDSTP
jgi:hypothetical protein